MTEERRAEILAALKKQTADLIAQGPEACRRHLIDLGIYTEDGELRPEYGGPGALGHD